MCVFIVCDKSGCVLLLIYIVTKKKKRSTIEGGSVCLYLETFLAKFLTKCHESFFKENLCISVSQHNVPLV